MRIMVTGGAGFLGCHLVDRLKTWHDVRVFDKARTVYDDVTDYDVVFADMMESDLVVHLAGLSGVVGSKERIHDYFHTNSFGTLNVLEAMRRNDVEHIIFSSSFSTYGVPEELPITERTPLNPGNVYGHSKVVAEELIRSYCEEYGMTATVLRISMMYGPGQAEMNAIQSFVDSALNGRPLVIFGDGNHTREYVYVGDAVDCIEKCIKTKPNGTFVVGTEKPYSINELAKMVADKILGTVVQNVPKTKFNFNSYSDCTKIQNEIGWRFRTELSDGIDRVIEWRKKLNGKSPSSGRA